MSPGEGTPNDDAGLLRRTLDGMPAGVLTVDGDDVIVQASRSALENAPSLRPGVALRPALEQLTHAEKVDRLLLRRQVSTFAGVPDGPQYHWMVWGERNSRGEIVMTFWEDDWNEVLNERRAAFTMAASHELRGPLTTLRGFAEILNMDRDGLTPEQAEAAVMIESTARLLAVLVDDVFDLSRNSFGELRLQLAEVDLGEILAGVVSSLEPAVASRGQELSCEIADLPPVQADRARVEQMISNLISNASVHNGAATRIEVTARREGQEIAITIADDGQGLPFRSPESAFRPFRRGDGAAEGDRTGSGVGLAITKLLIELHRGRVTVESAPGRGARFTLWFPLDREAAARLAPAPIDPPRS